MNKYYENHLDRLPLELIYYIEDIIESDKKYRKKRLDEFCKQHTFLTK